ncbi:MAG TPA: tetratricopeptide repeat protein [Candidatus Sulfotelmatobacter sp.]|nr:tetratricopeptide repeat protein [Candidatus Sulfotelmatobacter sp.]
MNFFGNYSFGFVFVAIAVVHFIRRRPDTFWLWIILMGGGLGSLIYIFVEVLPDLGLLRQSFQVFSHRKRIRQLETMVLDNPSAGNYEELADLYLEQKKFEKAKECYDRAISSRTDSPDPFYRRALCEIELNDFAAATADLERVVKKDPNYDYQRAPGLLAYAWSKSNQGEQAACLFEQVTRTSTLSETQFNYAQFLATQGKTAEARQWAQRVLNKKATMPGYLKRRERPWFRRASTLLKKLPA